MLKKIFWLALLSFVLVATGNSQCLSDRDSVKRYIESVQNSQKLSFRQKITILNSYLNSMERCSYKNDSIHVFLLMGIFGMHSYNNDYASARPYVDRAVEILTKNFNNPNINKRKLIGVYYHKAYTYGQLGNYREKIRDVNECIKLAIALKDSSDAGYARSLNDRMKYNYDLGDYQRCISDAIMCEKVTRNYFRNRVLAWGDLQFGTPMVLGSLGWYMQSQLALRNYGEAEKFFEEITKQYEQGFFSRFNGYVYAFYAQLQMQKGDHAKALSLLQKGLTHSRNIKHYYTCKQILNTMGAEVYAAYYKDDAKAMSAFRQALAYQNNNDELKWDDKMESLAILNGIANIYSRKGLYDSAIVYYRYALDSISKDLTEEEFLQKPADVILRYPKLHLLHSLMLDKADMYLKRKKAGDIAEAIHLYKLADKLLACMRGFQTDYVSKLFWRRSSRRLYENAIDACHQLNDPATAFYFFEKSRAVLLNDQLAQQHWMKNEDIVKQAQLKTLINDLTIKKSQAANDEKESTRLESEIFKVQEQLDNLEQKIRRQMPLYAQLGDTTCPALNYVQQEMLKDHAGLLEIFSGDSAVYTLFITKGKAVLHKIDKKDFDNTVNAYMLFISDGDKLNRDFAGFQSVSGNLYNLIFHGETVPDGRIIISPDGPLFPFESLVTGNGNYFLSTHAVSYTYSARYLLNDFMTTNTRSSGILLGVAPVQYSVASGLVALNGSDASLRKLSSYFSYSSQLVHGEALRQSFLRQFPSYKIIQLYTHASDSSDRNEPLIYFADSALYLSDLVPEQVPGTQLIVLSACNTGNGRLYRGEGVFSFNRGFAALGIPSCISNLWGIDNLSTYQLTENLYKYLAKGLPIDVALQKAKLEFLANAPRGRQLPYHWAPAILVGNTDPVAYPQKGGFQWILLLIVVSGIGLITWKWYRKKKQSNI